MGNSYDASHIPISHTLDFTRLPELVDACCYSLTLLEFSARHLFFSIHVIS